VATGGSRPDTERNDLFEPIPQVHVGEILGLIEYLDARGGQQDVFRIASDSNREFGRLIAVVNAAELLDWVETASKPASPTLRIARLARASTSPDASPCTRSAASTFCLTVIQGKSATL
jgi:NitT/TauT family transport system ATP-binding protein